MSVLEVGVTAAMALATVVAARRHPPTALALVLAGLLLGSASLGEVREVFLTARWGALVALPFALLRPFPTRPRDAVLELGAIGGGLILMLSALWSIDPELTLMRAASFTLLLLGLARLRNPLVGGWDPRGSVEAIAVMAAAVAAASLLLWQIRPGAAIYVGELRGILENQNGLGLFLGLTFPFVLAAFDRRFGPRVGTAALAVPVVTLVGLTESRTGAVALAVGVLVYELAQRLRARLALNLLVVVAGFLAASLSIGSLDEGGGALPTPTPGVGTGTPAPRPEQPPAEERPDVLGGGSAPGQSRLSALLGARDEGWNAAAGLIRDRPLLGYGFGSGDRVFARYPERAEFVYFQGANPNSGYLQALLELGFVLGLVVFAPLVAALAIGVRAARRAPPAPELAAFLACLSGGLVAAVFESLFTAAGAPWAALLWLSAAALVPLGWRATASPP